MRLAEFILANIEPILVEWESFARSIWPPVEVDPVELRDHAEEILRATAADMISPQTPAQQSAKSKGQGESDGESVHVNGAAKLHAVGRADSGLELVAVISEYRALRASVIRLWRESQPVAGADDLNDLTRFNESIDQSLAQGAAIFLERMNRSRQLLLGILGHDLRNPLNAIVLSAELLKRTPRLDADAGETARNISTSAAAMGHLIADLLDFTTGSLGGTMRLSPATMSLKEVCDEVINELNASHPTRKLHCDCEGDLTGMWDRLRIRQMLSNLVGNALQHGEGSGPVKITVHGDASDVRVSVHNRGRPIPPGALADIFKPMVRGGSSSTDASSYRGGVGLGLFIVREIVTAHGGSIDVQSSPEAGTTFTARLPRRTPQS